MSPYEITNLVVNSLTLFVLWLTLRAVKRYTEETKTLADAAVEQLPRPFVTVFRQPDPSDEALVEGDVLSINGISTIQFKNDGTAPAVNFRYWIGKGSAEPDGAPEMVTIAPRETFDSHYPRNAMTDACELVLEYESVGGARYRSSGRIEGRRWVKGFKVERV